jgi:iron complex outermembrane receptor protein
MDSPHPTGASRRPQIGAFGLLVSLALPALATTAQYPADFAELSIEELANIQVTSVSKRPERLLEAAASVYVITSDDIRRSGAATLPEVLRLAPNLQVAQASGSSYAITARGQNGGGNNAPNKLLVLIDGRSVYTPLFSGVFWDAQDVLLEDIDRIEVISGPGGTVWGVNAVNGVINITTRAAQDTQGRLLALRGADNGADVAFRHGGASGAASWRVYGKAQGRSHTELASGAPVDDAWRQAQAGFRADWERDADRFTVHGNAYRGAQEQPAPGTFGVGDANFELATVQTRGANLTGHWTHALAGGGSVGLQAYFDHTRREVPPTITESLDIADVQFQHALAAIGAHSLVWGANYRYSWDRVTNSKFVAFLPARLNQTWASLFAQDEIALGQDLRATLGARLERNDYTGTEFLPTARLSWTAAPGHAVWAAVSRTVRAPSRLDIDAFIPGPPIELVGNPSVRSEVAKVFELGYRGQPSARTSYSVTAFHTRYDHLRTAELLPSNTEVRFDNLMQGLATGIEMWGNYQASAAWRLSGGFTALHQRTTLTPGSRNAGPPGQVFDPAHTLQLRSAYSLDDARELDVGVRKVAKLAGGDVPGYTALDARFGWRLKPGLELSVAGYNLNGSHAEYGAINTRAEIARTVAVKLVWQD